MNYTKEEIVCLLRKWLYTEQKKKGILKLVLNYAFFIKI